MAERETKVEKAITKLEVEMEHVCKHLEKIDGFMDQLQGLMKQQSELQRDISLSLSEHIDIKTQLAGFGKRLNDVEKVIGELKQRIESIPNNLKVNIFDYIWKYVAIAIGGWIALKVSGILP